MLNVAVPVFVPNATTPNVVTAPAGFVASGFSDAMPEVGLFVVLNVIVKFCPSGAGWDVTAPLGYGLTIALSGALNTWPLADSVNSPLTEESKITTQLTPSVEISCKTL